MHVYVYAMFRVIQITKCRILKNVSGKKVLSVHIGTKFESKEATGSSQAQAQATTQEQATALHTRRHSPHKIQIMHRKSLVSCDSM